MSELTVKKAKEYLEKGHFGKGSMAPKVTAAIEFVGKSKKRQAIITSLSNADKVVETSKKTVIRND